MSGIRAGGPIAYLWGADAWSIDRAVVEFAHEVGSPGIPLEIWRVSADEDTEGVESGAAARRRSRLLDEVEARLSTGTLFGGGTLVALRQPSSICRERAARDRLVALVVAVAPGNALALVDLVPADGKESATAAALREAVAASGAVVREFPALSRDRLEAWSSARAAELGVTLGPGAARLLVERVGGLVREGDVDRRRQSEVAYAEIEKLALYRPGGVASVGDVAELVAEAIPGSTWAFLDALGLRRASEASVQAMRLLDSGSPIPVLVTQIYRRIRELVIVREHLDAGSKPSDLVRAMRVAPFRAQKLAEQARAWTLPELERALSGLVELDLRSKGISLDGTTAHMSPERDALGVALWLAEHVARSSADPPAVRGIAVEA
jgi:DNA polymerase III delta subunit